MVRNGFSAGSVKSNDQDAFKTKTMAIRRKTQQDPPNQASLPFSLERDALSLAFAQIPLRLRAGWALQAMSVRLAHSAGAVDNKELQAMLSSILVQLKFPPEHSEGIVMAAKKVSDGELGLLTAFGELIRGDAEFRPEKQSAVVKEPLPQVSPEERPFRILTQEDDKYKYLTEMQYKKKYANVPDPHSKEPLVWVNLKTGTFSLWVGKERRRREPIITGQKRILFCTLLRNFNKCIPTKELKEILLHHPQILGQLNNATFGVLKPFIEIHVGESRMLRPYSKYNHKRRFTFCLIEPVEASDDDK